MVAMYFGTDVYGAVARVDKTTIATKFAMLQFVPIWPQASFYYGGMSAPKGIMIPFIFTDQRSQIIGLPMAYRYWPSIWIAYLRGIAGALFLPGFMGGMVGGLTWLTGERMDEFAQVLVGICVSAVVIGSLLGAMTYLFAPRASRRDIAIRRNCAKVLGLAADPAMLERSLVEQIGDAALGELAGRTKGVPEVSQDQLSQFTNDELCLFLVFTRTQSSSREKSTDLILHELSQRGLITR